MRTIITFHMRIGAMLSVHNMLDAHKNPLTYHIAMTQKFLHNFIGIRMSCYAIELCVVQSEFVNKSINEWIRKS